MLKIAQVPIDSTPFGAEPGVSIHYVSCPPPADTKSKGTILLIHGFPQTWYQFRRVITKLADGGYNVIIPDYRGAGESTKPWDGYTKDVMARDLRTVVKEHERVEGKIIVVGHDIGGMIAHAYAAQFPDEVDGVVWGECPLPGSTMYAEKKHSPGLWHFTFHNIPDLPELLIQGKEKQYIKHFIDRLAQNPAAISAHDLEVYSLAYGSAGGMRAGLNCYRAFEQDAEINQKMLKEEGKCPVRCLGLWGARSFGDEKASRGMCEEFYKGDVEFEAVPGAGHWIAEEKPDVFVEKVLAFAGR